MRGKPISKTYERPKDHSIHKFVQKGGRGQKVVNEAEKKLKTEN